MRSAQSVKDRLKTVAKNHNRIVQDLFTIYVLKRVLYRLSVSRYRDNFSLKGGILLYGLFDQFERITTDIDLLGSRINNDADTIKEVFKQILQIDCDDAIRFDMDSIESKNIAEFKDYHGVNVSLNAFMDRTRIPVSIDVGFGDIIYPQRKMMGYPTLLDDEPPVLYVYSLESIIAEKFEAIVSIGTVNSRYKDFYDIYALAEQFDFKGEDLKKAIVETFEHRRTSFDQIDVFSEGFAKDKERNIRWEGFLKTKHVNKDISLTQVIEKIRTFIEPVIISIREEDDFNYIWKCTVRSWK